MHKECADGLRYLLIVLGDMSELLSEKLTSCEIKGGGGTGSRAVSHLTSKEKPYVRDVQGGGEGWGSGFSMLIICRVPLGIVSIGLSHYAWS
jgi:hypothetical protein